MPQLETFSYLIIGLQQLREQSQKSSHNESKYPYPDMFRLACNKLALKMPFGTYPRTQTGLLKLFEKPIEEWWPSSLDIPEDFDSSLLYDGNLSEEAMEHFYDIFDEENIPDSVSIQIAVENKLFQNIFLRLKEEYISRESAGIQEEYVKLRSFLINFPYTTSQELRKAFTRTDHILVPEVGDMYEYCDEGRV